MRASSTLIAWALCLAATAAVARDAAPAAADPVLEERMLAITRELRCLVCQNQTIADSTSDLAQDLRAQVRELLRRGDSDAQIRTYMTDRYGDFVLYRPPLKPTTLALWFGPLALLAVGFGVLVIVLRRRNRLGDEHFEPDLPDEADGPDVRRALEPEARP